MDYSPRIPSSLTCTSAQGERDLLNLLKLQHPSTLHRLCTLIASTHEAKLHDCLRQGRRLADGEDVSTIVEQSM